MIGVNHSVELYKRYIGALEIKIDNQTLKAKCLFIQTGSLWNWKLLN